jgi:hypothetical protein
MTVAPPPPSLRRQPRADAPAVMAPRARAITWRSVALGIGAVVLTCGLTPYNDLVIGNSVMIGSYIPLVFVIFFFLLIVAVNAPLHRWAPRQALSPGEMAIVLTMMLVSCSLPHQGMMRTLLPTMVAPFFHGGQYEPFWRAFVALDLPPWLFPVERLADGRSSMIVHGFYDRLPPGEPVPYGAWVVPLLGWGVFFAGLFTTLIALAAIVGQQWAVNERLAFPIAQLQYALIEAPAPGRALNRLFASRVMWIGLAAVFTLHALNGLNTYLPQYVPAVPLKFDLRQIFTEPPWTHFQDHIKKASLYFTLVGLAYFVQTRISFSIFAFVMLQQLVVVQSATFGHEVPGAAWKDQQLGASLVFIAGMLWIGRRYYTAVLLDALLPWRARTDSATPSHRIAVALAAVGVVVMFIWLRVVGVGTGPAVLILLFILLAHLVVARVVAETGLPFIRAYVVPFPTLSLAGPAALSGHTVFFANVFDMNGGAFTTRESVMTYALHGRRVQQSAGAAPVVGTFVLIGVALLAGYVVASVASLHCYYNHATTLAPDADKRLNPHVAEDLAKLQLVDPLTQWQSGRFTEPAHTPAAHYATGAGLMGVLQWGALRFASWPLMPVGYLLGMTWYAHMAWFSIFAGWMVKVLILRFGGMSMFISARPLFIGIVIGEALAAALWLVVPMILLAGGYEYKVVTLLP